MASVPDKDRFEGYMRAILEALRQTEAIPPFMGVDWSTGKSETAYTFIMDDIDAPTIGGYAEGVYTINEGAEQTRKPGWKTFNEAVAEDLKQKTKAYKAHIHWEDNQPVAYCPDCGENFSLHKNGECPDIIDATFKEEEPPLLPSGKE